MPALRIAIRLSLLLAGTSAIGATTKLQDIAPSTPWELRYADDSCYLARTFGQGDGQLQLRLSRFYPGPNLDVIVAGLEVAAGETQFPPQFYFEGQGLPKAIPAPDAYFGVLGNLPMVDFGTRRLDNVRLDQVPQVESHIQPEPTPEQEAAVDRAFVRMPNGHLLRLRLGSMKEPMAALRGCIQDAIRNWGFDPTEQANLKRRAWPDSWAAMTTLVQADYPFSMFTSDGVTTVHVRLDIDEAGKVSGCHVQVPILPNDIPLTTCRQLMAYGKFQPAINAEDKPTKSWFAATVRYRRPMRRLGS